MIQETDILEPLKLYNLTIKDDHHANAIEYFNHLVETSGVSEEENEILVKKVNTKKATVTKYKKEVGKAQALKGLCITGIVLGFLAAVVFFLICLTNPALLALFIVLTCVCVGIGVACIVLLVKKVNKILANNEKKLRIVEGELNDAIEEATAQLLPLNRLFDNNIPAMLFTKTIPLIKMDQYFDRSKFQYLHDNYGFKENEEQNISSLYIQSGSILGNPFLIERNYVQEMGSKTYTGTLTITYTVRVSNGKGGYTTSLRTQTLVAEVTKPCPYYYLDTWLVYSNDAAPDLHFSRQRSNANSMDEKQKEKFVKQFDKKLDKKIEKLRSEGKTTFQEMSNEKFEAFFNATNRDNEVQFRLLFTPLAQKNMLDLINTKEPYGDDFSFIKDGPLNYIKTEHAQHFDYEAGPEKFQGYDLKEMRNNFVAFNDDFMKHFYFDMAPLMCIPLYQQHQTFEFIYEGKFATNLTGFETEILANNFGDKYFAHPDTDTPVILKRTFVKANGLADQNIITAYSFKKVRRVEYVSKHGNDGCIHQVPVEWFEYVPLEQETEFTSQQFRTSEVNYREKLNNGAFANIVSQYGKNNAILYHRGLISFLASRLDNGYNGQELNNLSKMDTKEN